MLKSFFPKTQKEFNFPAIPINLVSFPHTALKQCYECISGKSNPTCHRAEGSNFGTKVDCTTACQKTTILGIASRSCVPGANYAPDATKDGCRKKEGAGEICFCRTDLCNGSEQSVKYSPILILLAGILAHYNLH